MTPFKLITRELAAAAAAWSAGNAGKARVCARRAVALADEAWLIRQNQPAWPGGALVHLSRIQQDSSFPLAVRQAAERLTTAVTRQQTAPFTLDPLGDAKIIIECLVPVGEMIL